MKFFSIWHTMVLCYIYDGIISYSIEHNYNEIKTLLSEVSSVIKLWPYEYHPPVNNNVVCKMVFEYLPPVNINVVSKNIWHKQRFCINNTSWKVFKYGVFSGLCFPVFTSNTGKYGPQKTPYLETFHAICNLRYP